MRNYHFILLLFAFALFLNACKTKNQKAKHNDLQTVEANQHKRYEIPRTRVIPIRNTGSGGQYELYIKLPEEYSKNKDIKYPVIYSTDAVWHVEILSGAVDYLMENAILVGISWEKDLKGELGKLEKELGDHAEEFISLLKNRNDESLTLERLVIEGDHQAAFPMTGVRSVAWLSNLTKK